MKFLYRIFKQDPENRDSVLTVTSSLGIAVNLLVAAVKILAGLAVSSIAVVSEGVNNATDAASSILALVGVRLAGKHPTAKHPFGYGRIEYLTSLVIAVLILFSGYELVRESIDMIFHPSKLEISLVTMLIVAVTAVIKFLLGTYTMKMGKKVNSSTLVALGMDGRNDSFISLITIVSALIFIFTDFSVDAYAGIIISLLILKAGLEVLGGTVGDLLGRSGDQELAAKLYRLIRETPGVINVADMMLHNYGPDKYSGSVNVEIDHAKTVGDIYEILHKLQLQIMHEYQVTMVFGIYAVNPDHEGTRQMRKDIVQFVREHHHIKSFHALYLDREAKRIYCDFIVDYELKDWKGLDSEFTGYMKERYPDYSLELVIETEFV